MLTACIFQLPTAVFTNQNYLDLKWLARCVTLKNSRSPPSTCVLAPWRRAALHGASTLTTALIMAAPLRAFMCPITHQVLEILAIKFSHPAPTRTGSPSSLDLPRCQHNPALSGGSGTVSFARPVGRWTKWRGLRTCLAIHHNPCGRLRTLVHLHPRTGDGGPGRRQRGQLIRTERDRAVAPRAKHLPCHAIAVARHRFAAESGA